MVKSLNDYDIDIDKILKLLNRKGKAESIKYVSEELNISLEEAKNLILTYYEYDGSKYRINKNSVKVDKNQNPMAKYIIILVSIAIIAITVYWKGDSILEIIHDPESLRAIVIAFFIIVGVIYLINYTPRMLKEGLTGLIVKSVNSVIWIFISIYLIDDLLLTFKRGGIDFSVIFILLFLGVLMINCFKNIYFSLYDLINNNVHIYKGKVEVRETGYAGRRSRIHRFIVLSEYDDREIPITNKTYNRIKDFKQAEIIYYKRSKILISASERE